MGQFLSHRMTLVVLAFSALLLCAGRTRATEITGKISTTLTIFDDSELVGDVTCDVPHAPCILFGAPHIKLRLNGFTITGPGGPPTNCTSTTIFFSEPEDGIDVLQDGVSIIGPGRVRNFRRYGILLGSFASGALPLKDVVLKRVTFSENCFSGLQTVGLDDSKIEGNTFARNAGGSDGFSCGGT
jgi:hypothetical protein